MRRQTHISSVVAHNALLNTSHQHQHNQQQHCNHNSVVSVVHSRPAGQPERDDEPVGSMFVRAPHNFALPFDCRCCGGGDDARALWDCQQHHHRRHHLHQSVRGIVTDKTIHGSPSAGTEVYPEYHYIATNFQDLPSNEYHEPDDLPAVKRYGSLQRRPPSTPDRIYENLNCVLVERQLESTGYGRIGQPGRQIRQPAALSAWNSKKTAYTTTSLTRPTNKSTPVFGATRKHSTNSLIEGDHTWDFVQPGKTLSCTGLLASAENIYENICDQCCAVYTGDECRKCNSAPTKTAKSTISTERVGALFTGLLSSFRSKSFAQKPRVRPTIVHNVDTAFCTNASFDLDEICRLKSSSSSSGTTPLLSPPTPCLGYPNKHFIEVKRKQLHTHSNGRRIDSTLNRPLHTTTHSTISPLAQRPDSCLSVVSRSPTNHRDVTNPRTNSRSAAIVVWMTSLRWSTDEYIDDDDQSLVFSVKRIAAATGTTTISKAKCCDTNGRQSSRTSRHDDSRVSPPQSCLPFADLPDVTNIWPSSEVVTVRHKSHDTYDNSNEIDHRRRWAVTTFRDTTVDDDAIHVQSTKSAIAESRSFNNEPRRRPVLMDVGNPHQIQVNTDNTTEHPNPNSEHTKEIICLDLISFAEPINVPKNDNDRPALGSIQLTFRKTTVRRPSQHLQCDRLTRWFLSISLNRALIIGVDPEQIGRFLSLCNSKTQPQHSAAPCIDVAQRFYEVLMNFVMANQSGNSVKKTVSHYENIILSTAGNSCVTSEDSSLSQKAEPPIIERRHKPAVVVRKAFPIPAPRQIQNTYQSQVHMRSDKPSSTETGHVAVDNLLETDGDDIYQSIWQYNTVGHADDITSYGDEDHDDTWVDDDSDENDDHLSIRHDVNAAHDNDDGDDSQSDGPTSWELADEFHFSLTTTVDGPSSAPPPPPSQPPLPPLDDPYRRICVLIGVTSVKHNQLLFDLSQPLFELVEAAADRSLSRLNENEEDFLGELHKNCSASDKTSKKSLDANNNLANAATAASVNAWRQMLRRVDYADDEEDVNLHGSFQPARSAPLATIDDFGNDDLSPLETKSIAEDVSNVRQSSAVASTKPMEIKSAYKSPTALPLAGTPSKPRNIMTRMKNKLITVPDHYDVASAASAYRPLYRQPFSKSSIDLRLQGFVGYQVFGVELDQIKSKDHVPLFVIECVRVIEKPENLETSGLYRASGKKERIDKLKKKINDSKKPNKYAMIESEDIHTITGVLKQFFRELKTELIPSHIVDSLPVNLDTAECVIQLREAILRLSISTRETLIFLLKHLIKVDVHRAHNLMNASNLSIVWGACIFSSSAMTLDTTDLMRKNKLFRVLLTRFTEIFDDIKTTRNSQ